MRRSVRVLALSAIVQAVVALCASAQTPDSGLDGAVRLWLGDPSLPAGFYRAVPDGDQWRLTIPLAGVVRPGVTADKDTGSVVATARRLPDGRWSIRTTSVPATLGLARESPDGARRQRFDLHCATQAATAVIDPALRLRSRFSAQAHDVTQTLSNGSRSDTTSFGDLRSKAAWQAVAGAGTQLDEGDQIANIAIQVPSGDSAIKFAAASVEETLTSQRVDATRVGRGFWLPYVLYVALSNSLHSDLSPRTGSRARPSPDDLAMAAETSRRIESLGPTVIAGTMKTMTLETGKIAATAGSGSALLSWGDPGGVADAKLGITLNDIHVAAKPGGPVLPAMLPRTVAIAVHAFGLPAGETADLMRRLVASGGKAGRDLMQDIPVLLDKGPLVIALDTFSMQDGPARLDAHATLKVIRPRLIEGEARITASGLDAFITRALTDPQLARVVPALIYGWGLGKRLDSGDMQWDVTLAAGHVVVNGLDVWPMLRPAVKRPAPLSIPPG